MSVLKSICIAISTYSILPAPRCEWTEQNLRFSICALPVVGIVIGGLLLLWHTLSAALGLGQLLFACVAVLIPLAVTGGIHMDGFCDTVDALASHQPPERKLEILKDPRLGAFAVLYCAAYLILCLGIYAELHGSGGAMWTSRPTIGAVAAGFVLSRALTALAAVTVKNARRDGMLVSFTRPVYKKTACLVSALIALLAGAAMVALAWQTGLICIALCLLAFVSYRRMALTQFGGVTGDTSGFFLQLCELAVLLSALIGTIMERLA